MKFKYILGILILFFLPNNIMARQISMYPNGIIVKSVNIPKVYYIENGKKRPIESPNMLTSQFRWQDVVIASPVELDALQTGMDMTYRDGALLSNRGAVYVISDGARRPIESANTFLQKGYKWSNVIAVSDSELAPHPMGAILTSGDIHPNGSLLVRPGGEVYVIKNGQRRYIPSPLIFEARYRWESLIDVSESYLNTYTQGENEFYPDGLLISSATGVYMMQNNVRQPITSPEVFESYGLNWGQVRRATDFELSIIPEGKAMSEMKSYPSRVLISPSGSSAVYVMDTAGVLRYIPSPFIFNQLNYKWDEIIKIPANTFKKYSIGEPMLFQNGTVVLYNGTVYLISNGYKKPIATPEVFLGLGYKWTDIIPLRFNEFTQYPLGTTITDVNNELYNVVSVNDGDDITVNLNGKIEGVKLIGIDAPEIDSLISSNFCYGIESYQALKNLIADNRVKLFKDPAKEDRDEHNRLLRYVSLENDTLTQEYMLKEGYAKEYTHKGISYQNQIKYRNIEQESRQGLKGLWGLSCNIK
jgi:endonuclease YncB( thermonuclease family)